MRLVCVILLTFLFACNNGSLSLKQVEVPADSTVTRLIHDKYTAGNSLDGGEFATVDSVAIERSFQIETTTRVIYFVHCSFQKAVRAPGYDTGIRPPIHQRDSIDIKKEGESWVMIGE